ncbi:MAG: HDOD domain-containing protein [Planctomycetota bacterium]|jgi:serine/threonine-protein kinase
MVDWKRLRIEALGERPEPIAEIQLPVLPAAMQEFCSRADDPDCSTARLAACIESDAALTAGLLRIVNSSAFGLRHRVSSVQHAIAALGIRRTRLNVISLAMRNSLPARQLKLLNMSVFWSTNLEKSLFARHVAELLQADHDLSSASALLQDFMLPLLTNQYESTYLEYLQGDHDFTSLAQFELKKFGWHHGEAAARAMCRWGFPDDLICGVYFHHQGLQTMQNRNLRSTAITASALAALMPDSLRQSPDGLAQLRQLDSVWKEFHLDEIAESIEREFRHQQLGSPSHISFREHCAANLRTAARRQELCIGEACS